MRRAHGATCYTASVSDLAATPYASLDPSTILDAVEHAGFLPTGGLLALNSYENRVYQIELETAPASFVIVKFYRPNRWNRAQILEEHAFSQELVDEELPIVAPLARDGTTLFNYAGYDFALFPRQGGHAPDLEIGDNLKVLARTIARIHAVGSRYPFTARVALNVKRLGEDSRDYLLQNNHLPAELEESYASTTGFLLERMQGSLDNLRVQRIHGDCHMGNLLWRGDTPHFVDFDDTVTGPTIQDVWMLLSGDSEERRSQLETIIKAYETFFDFDYAAIRCIETLRTLRIMHHAAWLARRWEDPAFPIAFPWFGQERYWS